MQSRRGSIFFIGTATTIIHLGSFTVLTDPNFLHAGEHVHLGYGLHAVRQTNPAIEVDQLPPLDLCVLSHMHGDHWDRVADASLPKDLPIVTTKHAAAALTKKGFTQPVALNTWEQHTLRKGDEWLRMTAMPGTHGPSVVGALLPPVMGSMIEWGAVPERAVSGPAQSAAGFRLYISGDTLVFKGLHEIPRRYPNIDLGLFHLGGTSVMGIVVTMDARQGVQALRIVRPKQAIPIHFNDYNLFKSPLEEFMALVQKESASLETEVHYLRHGQTFEFDLPTT